MRMHRGVSIGCLIAFVLLLPAFAVFFAQRCWVNRRSYVTMTGKGFARSRLGRAQLPRGARAAIVGAIMFFVADGIPTLAGPLVAFAILCALSGYMYWRAQQQKVDSNNVNAEWDDETNAVAPTAAAKV